MLFRILPYFFVAFTFSCNKTTEFSVVVENNASETFTEVTITTYGNTRSGNPSFVFSNLNPGTQTSARKIKVDSADSFLVSRPKPSVQVRNFYDVVAFSNTNGTTNIVTNTVVFVYDDWSLSINDNDEFKVIVLSNPSQLYAARKYLALTNGLYFPGFDWQSAYFRLEKKVLWYWVSN